METLGEVIAWLDALRQDLSDFLLRESEKGGAKIVGMAQDWIAAHYREAASLQEAARAVSRIRRISARCSRSLPGKAIPSC